MMILSIIINIVSLFPLFSPRR